MTLYLVKLDIENKDSRGEPKLVAVIGRIVESHEGHRFLPNVSGRKASRKFWSDALDCIPSWTNKMGFTRLYARAELDAATAAAAPK